MKRREPGQLSWAGLPEGRAVICDAVGQAFHLLPSNLVSLILQPRYYLTTLPGSFLYPAFFREVLIAHITKL